MQASRKTKPDPSQKEDQTGCLIEYFTKISKFTMILSAKEMP